MKKKYFKSTFIVAAFALAGIGGNMAYNKYATSKENFCVLLSQNIEALSFPENNVTNTGPGKTYDCPGLGTGDGKMCMCENSNPCTQIPC